ncbi:DNA internalization-related competence protein ComEC/Rec2 [Fructobacillus sp. M2-14]|uniref:DNA internalization-related competence protein ComEC/Rec2 n=1 Tax=Fructobacillus broussonetiae TaxID=2713173 RepID=A0ABS5R080_9LACO|nr:DNA internalization-related competence protein ComEC/Rec2 [Fructobacillus broussonetiae]MBS9338854.1 DNA internalization-related competence protein ComEC/Rec2 [Fructobacillus broussonetiae]
MNRERFWMLLALTCAALSLIVYRPNACTTFLFLLVLSGCLTIRVKKDLLKLGLFSALFFGYIFLDHATLVKQRNMPVGEGCYELVVQPDDFSVNEEGIVRGKAKLARGMPVYFSYRAKNQKSLDDFLMDDGPLNLSANGELKRIVPATNLFQFDWVAFMESKHITHQIVVRDVSVKAARPSNPLQACFFQLRTWHARAETWTNSLPNPFGNYTKALLLGGKADELYEENPKISELGLVHLFSLSGLHVGFLLAAVSWFGQRLRIFKEMTSVFQAVALPMFYLFTGSPPVLVRAVVAGEARLVKESYGTVIDSQVIWAWSLLGGLIVTPQILLTLGGQLSFALTLAVTMGKDLNYWQKGLFLSSVTFPIIMAWQSTWNCWQSVANILAVPIFSSLVLPVVLLGLCLGWVPGVLSLSNVIVWLFDRAVYCLGMLPGNVVLGAFSWPVLIVLFTIPFCFLYQRRLVKVGLTVSWCLLLSGSLLAVRFNRQGEFTTFDIGQGDAAVLIEPMKHSVTVFDTGGKVIFGHTRKMNLRKKAPAKGSDEAERQKEEKKKEGLARSVIVPYLHARGVSKIDTLSLSHQDQDHIGDARVILECFKVNQLVMPAGMVDGSAFKKKIQPYLRRTKVIEATDKVKVENCPLRVLYPFNKGEEKNEDSLAWGGAVGGRVFFTAGDLDKAGEKKLAGVQPAFHPEVVKFGHHGSKTASSAVVFAKWKPKIGIVSAGRNSRYGHPHQATLDTAAKYHMIVYSTQRQGMLRYVYVKNHGHFEVTLKHDPTGP